MIPPTVVLAKVEWSCVIVGGLDNVTCFLLSSLLWEGEHFLKIGADQESESVRTV